MIASTPALPASEGEPENASSSGDEGSTKGKPHIVVDTGALDHPLLTTAPQDIPADQLRDRVAQLQVPGLPRANPQPLPARCQRACPPPRPPNDLAGCQAADQDHLLCLVPRQVVWDPQVIWGGGLQLLDPWAVGARVQREQVAWLLSDLSGVGGHGTRK